MWTASGDPTTGTADFSAAPLADTNVPEEWPEEWADGQDAAQARGDSGTDGAGRAEQRPAAAGTQTGSGRSPGAQAGSGAALPAFRPTRGRYRGSSGGYELDLRVDVGDLEEANSTLDRLVRHFDTAAFKPYVVDAVRDQADTTKARLTAEFGG